MFPPIGFSRWGDGREVIPGRAIQPPVVMPRSHPIWRPKLARCSLRHLNFGSVTRSIRAGAAIPSVQHRTDLSAVRVPVQLDRQVTGRAAKVDDERADGVLASKTQPVKAIAAQVRPELLLGRCLVLAQLSGVVKHFWSCALVGGWLRHVGIIPPSNSPHLSASCACAQMGGIRSYPILKQAKLARMGGSRHSAVFTAPYCTSSISPGRQVLSNQG